MDLCINTTVLMQRSMVECGGIYLIACDTATVSPTPTSTSTGCLLYRAWDSDDMRSFKSWLHLNFKKVSPKK